MDLADDARVRINVREWLATLAYVAPGDIALRDEVRAAGSPRMLYSVGPGAQATVALRGLPSAGSAIGSWEVVVTLDGLTERVEVSAGTRFVWT